MKKIDVLFGGGGYLGHYLARELLSRQEKDCKHIVYSMDETRTNKVPGVFNLVPAADGTMMMAMIDGLEAGTDTFITFYHLACPRNKKGSWDLDRAVDALWTGINLSQGLSADLVFASSMSVFDDPPSPYGAFKRTAEVAVKAVGGHYIRFGTLLGADVNMPYRNDLGLHMIALALANGIKAWVNSDIQRYMITAQDAARRMANIGNSYPPTAGSNAHHGLFKYANVVPDEVDRRMPEKDYYTIEGKALPKEDTREMQTAFDELTNLIEEEKTWAI
jgi:nucleoside-diphosphate-sugar epimerase